LHVLEALIALSDVERGPAPRAALAALLRLLLARFLSPDGAHSYAFLDERLVAMPGPVSYGHDIETSWLLDAAAVALGDSGLAAQARAAASTLARATIAAAQMDDGSVLLERASDGRPHPWRIWWVQAEALVGLINEAQRGGFTEGLARAERLWDYIATRMVDPVGGEWHARVGPDGVPDRARPKVEPWKGPYHHGRACLELIERAQLCAKDGQTPPARIRDDKNEC
jgi:mannobiose 2-epimerase